VDLFAGTVIELAQRYGMSVPVNQMLYQKIKDMETNW
jgi:2-dehydropantoate 2-reductase